MYVAERPCCLDPLSFSLGSDDLSRSRDNPLVGPQARLLRAFLSSRRPHASLNARALLARHPPGGGARGRVGVKGHHEGRHMRPNSTTGAPRTPQLPLAAAVRGAL